MNHLPINGQACCQANACASHPQPYGLSQLFLLMKMTKTYQCGRGKYYVNNSASYTHAWEALAKIGLTYTQNTFNPCSNHDIQLDRFFFSLIKRRGAHQINRTHFSETHHVAKFEQFVHGRLQSTNHFVSVCLFVFE